MIGGPNQSLSHTCVTYQAECPYVPCPFFIISTTCTPHFAMQETALKWGRRARNAALVYSMFYATWPAFLAIAGTPAVEAAYKNWNNSYLYEYRPLKNPKSTLRLLKIERKNGRVTRELIHINTDELPGTQYSALSYVWHIEPEDRRRKCRYLLDGSPSGKTVWVTPNLFIFLKQFERTVERDTAELIYIDGLCINQESQSEKADQIRLMRQVYGRATKTIVWLGTAIKYYDGRDDFSAVADSKTHDDYSSEDNSSVDDSSEEENELYPHDPYPEYHYSLWEYMYNNKEPEYPDSVYRAVLRRICDHVYWERLWIVQECLLAGETEIWCDFQSRFNWDDIDRVMREMGIGGDDVKWTDYERKARKIFDTKRELYDAFQPQSTVLTPYVYGLDMKDALYRFGRQKCSDMKDNVYGLLGIIKRHDIEVRYDAQWPIDKVVIQVLEQVWGEIGVDSKIPPAEKVREYNRFVHFVLNKCFRPSGEARRLISSAASRIALADPASSHN
ncbi:unnamed protein product [Periconia digitata]|uniref:Heterokaryon incompatibility domain-containing protein n=1 Tax=Periconia digitata TaxID=1303443 RepID=A0A9W4XUS4_9PLEO|nr:unnamed protein product [Periconia digitata]